MGAISVPPSLLWEGSLGPWSSFFLEVGSPQQRISVLPATSKSNVWAVVDRFCSALRPIEDCATFRGGLFSPEESTTFSNITGEETYLQLPFISEAALGYEGNSSFGLDIVSLEGPDGSEHFLQQQPLATFDYTEPFMATGLLGLSAQSFNLTDDSHSHSSPLSTLRETGQIPSTFYGYNAGVQYLQSPVFASLTLGGYDAGRGGSLKDALTVDMAQDPFIDLVVSVEKTSLDGQIVNTESFSAFIDSVVPDLWLPQAIYQALEAAFDLQWDAVNEMYLLSDEHANALRESEKNVTFTLADLRNAARTYKISLPAKAFVLEAKYPFAGIQNNSVRPYFAVKRAESPTEYFLGHTFLQEAYIAVDYDRHVFYLSQADFQKEQDIKTVFSDGKKNLSTGALAGIVVAILAIAAVAGALVWWSLCRPRMRKRRNSRFRARMESQNAGLPDTQMPPPEGTEMHEFYGKRPFSVESEYKQELDAATTARGSVATRAEMDTPPASGGASPRSKMSPRRTSYGFPSSPAELESRSPRMMHSRTASGSSVEPMSPLSGNGRTELPRTEEDVHELP